jgi:hypothetical protein
MLMAMLLRRLGRGTMSVLSHVSGGAVEVTLVVA